MFTCEALRARALPVLDGIDERPMMVFRDGANLLTPRCDVIQDDALARRNKWEPVNLIHRSSQGLALREVKDGSMKNFIQV